jgi:ferredoxin
MGLPALPIVNDSGMDLPVQELTPERIAEVFNRIMDNETAARFRVYLNTCVHCGLCSDACHWFLSNDRDPRFSPVGKVKQTLWELVKKKGRVKPEFIKECSRISQTECNVCRRCSMYCPYGIDIA